MSHTELLNPLEFSGLWSIFCSNEVALGGLLYGDWSQERGGHDSMLGTFSPSPCLLAKGEDLKIELIFNDVHMVKPPFKESLKWDFCGGPTGKTVALNARVLGSFPGQGTRSHMPQLTVHMLRLRPSSNK